MKPKHGIPAVVIGLLLFTALIGSAAEKVWVTSEGASLKADRSSLSATVAELTRGTELVVTSCENRWCKVTTPSGKTGWIYQGRVSDAPPEINETEGEAGLGDMLGGLSESSIEADASDSARSIRGLSPEAAAYAKNTGKPEESQKALDQLLSLTIPANEIEQFLKQGKIGEYAQ